MCSEVILCLILVIILSSSMNRVSAGLKKKPENWKPQRRNFIEIESTKTFKDGKSGTEAELAFYSRNFGFVNNDRDRGEFFYFVLKNYLRLKSGHKLEPIRVPLHMLEELNAFMKVELCRKYLNEPLLRYNRILFNEEAPVEKILIVEKTIRFRLHDVPPETETLVRCPVVIDEEENGYLFMTMVERAEFEQEDHYYVFTEVEVGVVAPLMRSKHNTGSLVNELFGSLARTVGKYKNKFLDFAAGSLPEDDKE